MIEVAIPLRPAEANELYAVAEMHRSPVSFVIYSGGEEVITHRLPVYSDKVGRTGQVLLTPLAVATDVTLFSAVFGLVGWLECGMPPLSEQSRGYP